MKIFIGPSRFIDSTPPVKLTAPYFRHLDFEMFYLVGLGLGDARDITVRGLEVVKSCARVYLEAYTSQLTCGHQALVSIENIT